MNIHFYPLHWHIADAEIQIYGWSHETGENVPTFVRVTGFSPYLYIKLPVYVKSEASAMSIKKYIEKTFYTVSIKFCRLKSNYSNAHEPVRSYLFVTFPKEKERAKCKYSLKRHVNIPGFGAVQLICCDKQATPFLQFVCSRKISTSDWFTLMRAKTCEPEKKLSTCAREYSVFWKDAMPYTGPALGLPSPLIMSYDIETYAHCASTFPDANHPDDTIFQVSMIFMRQGKPLHTAQKLILSLGNPNYAGEGVKLIVCKSEKSLLLEYVRLVNEYKPDLLIGYNTFGFDNKYMYTRAMFHQILDEFVRHGVTYERADRYKTEWASSAYGKQDIFYIDIKGRVHVDLLTLIRRDHKLRSYKLSDVAQHFVKGSKDPLTHYDIRNAYHQYLEAGDAQKELNTVARYCVKDSLLVIELFEYLKLWFSLTAMAKICFVPFSFLFQRGQQVKVYSQVYNYCFNKGIVVEEHSYEPPAGYFVQGAYVLDPIVGFHKNVVSFDFASLYPSVIVSHNISYDTFVKPEQTDIADEDCHIIEWEEHFGCSCPDAQPVKKVKGVKHIVCAHRRFRWLKTPMGILPAVVQGLLDARKAVKQGMQSIDKSTIDYTIADILQTAYKLSANSAYGGLASTVGPLVFTVGGMSVTAIGRRSLLKTKHMLETYYKAMVTYGDTDSCYVFFKDVPPEKLDNYCIKVAQEISQQFPPPMKLEYEKKIYEKLFFFTKKRYAYIVHGELSFKGILLQRRDTFKLLQDSYKKILLMIINSDATAEQIDRAFFEELAILCSGCSNPLAYTFGSSLKGIDNFQVVPKSESRIMYGDYTISKLSTDEKKRATQLKNKGATTEEEFYQRSLPKHIQLAVRMRARGQTVQAGGRIGLIYTKNAGPKSQAWQKVEEIEYFEMFYSRKHIDTLHYAKLFLNAFREMLSAYTGKDLAVEFKVLAKSCENKARMLSEFKDIFCSVIFQD